MSERRVAVRAFCGSSSARRRAFARSAPLSVRIAFCATLGSKAPRVADRACARPRPRGLHRDSAAPIAFLADCLSQPHCSLNGSQHAVRQRLDGLASIQLAHGQSDRRCRCRHGHASELETPQYATSELCCTVVVDSKHNFVDWSGSGPRHSRTNGEGSGGVHLDLGDLTRSPLGKSAHGKRRRGHPGLARPCDKLSSPCGVGIAGSRPFGTLAGVLPCHSSRPLSPACPLAYLLAATAAPTAGSRTDGPGPSQQISVKSMSGFRASFLAGARPSHWMRTMTPSTCDSQNAPSSDCYPRAGRQN